MPKVATPLLNQQCKPAKAKHKEFTLPHAGGMGLRVMPNGKRNGFAGTQTPTPKFEHEYNLASTQPPALNNLKTGERYTLNRSLTIN